ncbi:carbohydrate ABC transporter permease [Angustibacter luteus]|uniref:Carbohydrate ABC transporter permease n=1 Tax=Angustibacter luteus TaxID=658456 RepID=A0ABW1JAB7_9ACTN
MSAALDFPASPLEGVARASQRSVAAGRGRTRKRVQRVLFTVAGLVVFVVSVFPVYWMVSTALLPNRKIRSVDPTFAPISPTLDNFRTVLKRDTQFPFLDALRVSLSVTTVAVAVALVIGLLAALAITRFTFLGRRGFIFLIIAIQMLPGEAMIISLFRLLDGWHLTNTVLGLSAVYVAAVLPFTIWTLRGFVAGIPVELEEAAMIDGCSRLRSFRSITLPLIGPGLVATGVFAFIQAWNEFVLALVLMNRPDHLTLPVWLRSFRQVNSGTDWGAIMAGSTLMTIPVIVFFLFVQGRMASGLVSGAVKG